MSRAVPVLACVARNAFDWRTASGWSNTTKWPSYAWSPLKYVGTWYSHSAPVAAPPATFFSSGGAAHRLGLAQQRQLQHRARARQHRRLHLRLEREEQRPRRAALRVALEVDAVRVEADGRTRRRRGGDGDVLDEPEQAEVVERALLQA